MTISITCTKNYWAKAPRIPTREGTGRELRFSRGASPQLLFPPGRVEHCLAPLPSPPHTCTCSAEEQQIPSCPLALSPAEPDSGRTLLWGQARLISAQSVLVCSLPSQGFQAAQSPSQLFHPISLGIREDWGTQSLRRTY